ncbi:uncharacterized protein LOC128549323 [Mercenaria mercenaria]|uniref:uncharacterized protein LOC128549323 n=1 Tax=Mercenaria mercenaria TaxID=6596 RepID=UPI00234F9C25|nr:uncharacterized protein LOC128549323 [Mercenaria mercenaria]
MKITANIVPHITGTIQRRSVDISEKEHFKQLTQSLSLADKNFQNTDDEKGMEKFKENLTFKDGRYQVTWPWKEENPELPENRQLALGRLKSMICSLQRKPDIVMKYNSVIEDQLKKGIIEKVDRNHRDGIAHYFPHHPVIKPDKNTTKVRIVYDASTKSKSGYKSLNECLYRGPVLLKDLCGTGLKEDIFGSKNEFARVGLKQRSGPEYNR